MSELCEHDTFQDICGTCHRDAQITRLKAEVARSWFCEKCKVEVYQTRCPHCGKSEKEKR